MDPDKVLVWIQIGNTLTQVAIVTIGKIHELLDDEPGADDAALAKIDREYAERIARAEAAAKPPG